MPFCPVADLAAQWVLLDDRIAADWLPADDPALCLAADERRLAIETSVMHLPIASDAGAAFVAWLLSEDGQRFTVAQGYMPLRPEAGAPPGRPASVKLLEVAPDTLAATGEETRRRFAELFGG